MSQLDDFDWRFLITRLLLIPGFLEGGGGKIYKGGGGGGFLPNLS